MLWLFIMTSWHEYPFHITGPLAGVPSQWPVMWSFWCFRCCCTRVALPMNWDAPKHIWRHCDVLCLQSDMSTTGHLLHYYSNTLSWFQVTVSPITGKWNQPVPDLYVSCSNQINILPLSVREITNSSSSFSATNFGSNLIWFLQLHDTINMRSLFATKSSSIYLAKGEKRVVFQLSFVNLQRAKDGTHLFEAKYRYVFVV